MSKVNVPVTANSQTESLALEQNQQTHEGQVKAGPPPQEKPKPGRKPLFRI